MLITIGGGGCSWCCSLQEQQFTTVIFPGTMFFVTVNPAHLLACLVLSTTILNSSSCAGDTSAQQVEFFEKHIRPLLAARCYSCHAVKTGKAEGDLTLDSRRGWQNGGENGPAIVPGDVAGSLLIAAVRYEDDGMQMPPDKALPAEAVVLLERWVKMGAPDPRDQVMTHAAASPAPSDPVAGRLHWAFRPLRQLEIPDVKTIDWSRSEIDHFVLAELEAADLAPATDADRRALLRRTCFQLTGLPPTEEQSVNFLSNQSHSAFAQLVDELLASRHFGERWGRHWLDLARYADSNGLDENFLFREAWRYRNWAIAAVNDDMPYNEFLRQQIAGDLLPFDSVEQHDRQRVAAGFLVMGPKVLLGNNAKERIMDVADEQLDTIGKTVLGQTLGCARCHDHKFDPVPTADYYALAGIFTSTNVMEQRYMLGQQRVMEQLVGLGPNGEEVDNDYEAFWRSKDKHNEHVKQANQALKLLKEGDRDALTAFSVKHENAVAEGVLDETLTQEERVKRQETRVAEVVAAAKPREIPPRAMVPSDSETPKDEAIRIAGQFDQPGDTVARGVLRVVSDHGIEIPAGQSGRLQLADWLCDVENGAGRVAARVYANRVWRHLIGRGLVRTVDNFGRTGEEPSHPELLDHLATRLIESGWSTKALIREIVLSRTFALSSEHNGAAQTVDPDNHLLWRAHRRRLEPEAIRDAMLSAAATLDLTPMDSTVSYLGDQATAVGKNENRRRTDFPCRSVYLPVIRNDLPEVFDAFDFADPHATTGMRPETMVATQGLFILNDKSVMDAAEATTRRILNDVSSNDTERTVDSMFELVVNDSATAAERGSLVEFIQSTTEQLKHDGEKEPAVRALAIACHALFASSRFQILE